jgi:hypothetical protein
MNVLVGKSKEVSVKAEAKLVTFQRSGSAELETWSVELDGRSHTFQCYDDRRGQWIRQGKDFGTVETKEGDLYVWKDEG